MDYLVRLNRFLDAYLTPVVKTILLINVGVFLFFTITYIFRLGWLTGPVFELLMITPRLALGRAMLWQFVTYMFLHVDIFHLLFNMLALWFFGPPLEGRWGAPVRFWSFYLFSGGVGAVLYAALSYVTTLPPGPTGSVLGASGAMYGILLAYAAYWPNRAVYVFGIIPIQVKYLVPGLMVIALLSLGSSSSISNLMHLTGLGAAYLYLWRYHHTPDVTRWRFMR